MTTPRAVIHTYTQRQRKVRTHHLGELDGRVAHFIPDPDRNLNSQTKAEETLSRQQLISSEIKRKMMYQKENHAHATRNVKCMRGMYVCCAEGGGGGGEGGRKRWWEGWVSQRTSLSNFTLALNPSMASSFWPSRSSAKRAPEMAAAVSDEAL